MAIPDPSPTSLRLECRLSSTPAAQRINEPVTIGLPFPRGWCQHVEDLSLVSPGGDAVPLQVEALDRWSDGSVRWALLDFAAALQGQSGCVYELHRKPPHVRVPSATSLTVTHDARETVVDTGAARFAMRVDGILIVRAGVAASDTRTGVHVTNHDGVLFAGHDGRLVVEQAGPLRTVVLLTMQLRLPGSDRRLDLFVRYHFFAGLPTVRLQVTLRNPHRARHDGGYWELGDRGSQLLRDLSFTVTLPGEATAARCSPEPDAPMQWHQPPFSLYQESSGGERWDAATHVNREGRVPMQMRGYRLSAADGQVAGERATPIVEVAAESTTVALAHSRFWERFPKVITVADASVRLGLLPSEFPDLHELQGGEQITEDFVVSFGNDGIAADPLAWVRDPVQVIVNPEWYCSAEAMPSLVPAASDPHRDYLALVDAAVDGPDGFLAKRERIDEYGWRNFGDLYADHETVHHQEPELFVSHYNNQYDAAAGLAIHFFRSGNRSALTLFDDLVRHLVDVDIYHTTEDKPAYNHGLFWHTAHHVNAGRATHRTYPRGSGASGGPSAEHNYNTGLMLHYFLTGDRRSREAAVELGRWVIDMDDGTLTPLRWLSRAPTGFASATGSFEYHGPGRGPGNGIVAVLNAYRLSGDRRFMDKAEALIRRCVHPEQDLEALNLLDTERRWYYTVFLQALARYLGVKSELGEFDPMYEYARQTLLHYARWMAQHEYPYLERPDRLEFPTETWVAQDMRKSDVFAYAAGYGTAEDRDRFLERAAFFFSYSVTTLTGMPSSGFTRPRVLMLTNGYIRTLPIAATPRSLVRSYGKFIQFKTQRQIAGKRAIVLVAAAAGAVMGILTAAAW